MSFIVWGDHSYLTGHGHEKFPRSSSEDDDISIQVRDIFDVLFHVASGGGSIRFNKPMLFDARVSADVSESAV